MEVPETAGEYVELLLAKLEELRKQAQYDAATRKGLLSDPKAELQKAGFAVVPKLKIRFFEVEEGEIALPLPPFSDRSSKS